MEAGTLPKNVTRYSDRSVRGLITLFHIDWLDDVAEFEKVVNELQKNRDDETDKSNNITHCGGDDPRFKLTATSIVVTTWCSRWRVFCSEH